MVVTVIRPYREAKGDRWLAAGFSDISAWRLLAHCGSRYAMRRQRSGAWNRSLVDALEARAEKAVRPQHHWSRSNAQIANQHGVPLVADLYHCA